MMRLSNILPSNILNLSLPTTRLPLMTLLWASWIGKAPGIVIVALIGASLPKSGLEHVTIELGWGAYVGLAIGFLATVVLAKWMAVKVKHELA